jgi:hypothetical protein
MRTAKSCGPDTPTLVSSLAVTIRETTGARKPGSPGRARRTPLKPPRREGRMFGQSCGDCRQLFYLLAGHGCGLHPAFPAPSVFGGTTKDPQPGRDHAAGGFTHVGRLRWNRVVPAKRAQAARSAVRGECEPGSITTGLCRDEDRLPVVSTERFRGMGPGSRPGRPGRVLLALPFLLHFRSRRGPPALDLCPPAWCVPCLCAPLSAPPVFGGPPSNRWPVRFSLLSQSSTAAIAARRLVRLSCVAVPRQVCLRG